MSSFAGKRILVLEDEFLLAMDVVDTLEGLGAIVIGPAHRIDTALALLGEPMDAALLDVNIGGVSSGPVAERLATLGVPVIFATGYGVHADVMAGSVILDKPYTREQVEAAMHGIFG